jgi:hypothetical protein
MQLNRVSTRNLEQNPPNPTSNERFVGWALPTFNLKHSNDKFHFDRNGEALMRLESFQI